MALNISDRSGRIMLGSALALALVLRLAWVTRLPGDETYLAQLPDQLEYLELGRNVAHGDGLKFLDESFRDEVFAYRMPGYPLLIAACRGNVYIVQVAQALIDTSTVLAVYLLARRWLARGPSLFAALLIAVNPFATFFTGLVLSETLYASMLTWGMAAIVRPSRNGSASAWDSMTWWCGALLLVLSIHVRPSAIVLPVLLGIVSAMTNRRSRGPYQSRWLPPVGATMLILTLAALLPWAYRNHRVLGAWTWTTTNSGITLYDGFNPDATGASDQTYVRSWPALAQMSETERSEYLSELAWQYIQEHPRRALDLSLRKIARTWSPVPLSEEYGSRRNRTIAALYMVPFYVLLLIGLWSGRLPALSKVFLMLPAIYFTVVHAASVGSLRYRLPADVPMAVIASVGVASFGRFRSGSTTKIPTSDANVASSD